MTIWLLLSIRLTQFYHVPLLLVSQQTVIPVPIPLGLYHTGAGVSISLWLSWLNTGKIPIVYRFFMDLGLAF